MSTTTARTYKVRIKVHRQYATAHAAVLAAHQGAVRGAALDHTIYVGGQVVYRGKMVSAVCLQYGINGFEHEEYFLYGHELPVTDAEIKTFKLHVLQ